MSQSGSKKRSLEITGYRAECVETFDTHFWPVVVGLCTLSAFSAGAIITLLDGAAMWISLLALPLFFFLFLLLLRLLDNRRLRRSLQLGLLLSITLHLVMVIFSSRIELFHGLFKPQTAVSQRSKARPRTVEVSIQRPDQPWLKPNETPLLEREEPQPEREQPTVNQQVEPKPVELEPTPPQPQQQITKRATQSQSTPKTGQSLSQLSRSETSLQPTSSTQAESARASAANPATAQATPLQLTEKSIEATRSQASASEVPPNQRAESRVEVAQGMSMSAPAEPTRRQPTATAETANALAASPSTRVVNAMPETNLNAETTHATSITSSRPASQASEAAHNDMRHASTRSAEPQRVLQQGSETSLSRSEQQARPQRRENANVASVQLAPEVTETQRRAMNPSVQPTTTAQAESPRIPSQTVANQAAENMPAREIALDRSSSGTAGIGQSKNTGREIGSLQSPAQTAMEAARRDSQLNRETATAAFTPVEASQTPGRIASATAPTSTMIADNTPSASLSATSNLHTMSDNASAATISTNTAQHRDQISAERGQTNVDTGAMRVVADQPLDKLEGGGQPELNRLPEGRGVQSREMAGSPTPTLDSNVTANDISAPFSAPSARAAESSFAEAPADITSQRQRGDQISSQRATMASLTETENQTGTASGSEISRRQGTSDNFLNQQAARSSGNVGTSSNEEDDDAGTRPAASLVAQAESAASQSRGTGMQTERTSINDRRMSTAGSINPGLENANRLQTQGSSMQAESELSRRGSGPDQTNGSSLTNLPDASQPGKANELAPHATVEAQVESRQFANFDGGRGADTASLVERDLNARKQDVDGMTLDIDARRGAAGLDRLPQPEIGVENRRTSLKSQELMPEETTRFIRETAGGTPNVNPNAVVAQQPFRGRSENSRATEAPYTEEAIELGLAFLARYQHPDGSWSLGQFDVGHPERALQFHSDTAATGLALLAFQGAGYNHLEFKYADKVAAGIRWLISNQKPNGDLYVESDLASNNVCRFYSHGIAALALAEAYGMTHDPEVKLAAQKAINFIELTQHSKLGGWRYSPGINSDTSVTGWMVMALQSARLAGLDVKPETLNHVKNWLDFARDTDLEHKFRYRPDAVSDQQYDRSASRIPNPSMSSVGLLMRLYLGWNRNDQRLIRGADYLLEHLPSDATETQRDTYYWYYATQVLRHVGGERWERWNSRLHPLLTQTQIREGDMAGSWHPYEPVPDSWGRRGGGRLYVTTMNLLSLEVDYRLLPLYDETAK
ncbi:MAG TPA: prenyltransferase/squalene oxidase repeat-containing protein [Pirellulaceae bacterium]|nr:prenyltransferase/squalene oxidase repeat-containing protein [Pirellulaceae bacterium]HMO92243.1 prenyltransferase/squalene oxidase repeat-containing protein [Pirellulaceae bacterium]